MVDGVNRRCRDIVDSILHTVNNAKREHGITAVVQLGDFFDGPKPSAAVLDIAIRMIQETGVPWYIIAGNHDIASYDAPSAIAPLGHVDGIHTYDRPELVTIGMRQWAMVPYTGPSADLALRAASGVLSGASCAAVHYGLVYDRPSRPDLISRDRWLAAIGKGSHTFGFFGHEHTSRALYTHGRSLGAFTQSNFTDAGGGCPVVAIVTDSTTSARSIYDAPGPRFLDMTSAPSLDVPTLLSRTAYALGQPLYIMVHARHIAAAQALLDAGVIQGYKIQPAYSAAGTDGVGSVVASTMGVSPMDVVYTVTGATVAADILEDVVAILEQDMQE